METFDHLARANAACEPPRPWSPGPGAVGLLAVAAVLAALHPASRATRMDPARVLREE